MSTGSSVQLFKTYFGSLSDLHSLTNLQVELRKKERDLKATGKEVSDLQAQVSYVV